MAGDGELLIMAVTRLGDGVCVAGVNPNGRWVRPTRENAKGWRQLTVDDLKDSDGRVVVKVGNVVQWPLGAAVPRDVHTEDVLVSRTRPRLVRTLPPEQLLARCMELRAWSLDGFLRGTERSLMLLQPPLIRTFDFSTTGKGGISARIHFVHGAMREDFSVTDVTWRAMGRHLLERLQAADLSLTEADLHYEAGLAVRYLAVGRGQLHEGRYWPFFISVFTDPPISTAIDYAQL
jgi:hypothetical protein